MDMKKFNGALNEMVAQLEHDVRILKTQQQTLNINLKDLEEKRNKISSEIASLENKHADVVNEYKQEIDKMMASAQEKLDRANSKESEANSKLSEVNKKLKEVTDLIKSNEGIKDSLNKKHERSNEVTGVLEILVDNLEKLAENIIETLKTIK